MPEFSYRAINSRGEIVTGSMNDDDAIIVQQLLKNDGLMPVKIQQSKDFLSLLALPAFKSKKEVSGEAISHFCRQLSVIMRSGVNLLKGLEVMGQQCPDRRMQTEIKRIYQEVQTGRTIAEAISDLESPLPQLLASMVATGEASGTLDEVLRSLADFYDKEHHIKQKIKSASIYPLVMAVMSIGLIAFFFNFLLPQLISVITASGGQLPILTRIIINISEFTSNFWYLIIALLTGLTIFISAYFKTANGRLHRDKFIFHIPLLGKTLRDLATMRFARTTHILVKSGLPLLQGLDYVRQNVNNAIAEQAVEYAIDGLQRGEPLAPNLAKVNYFDNLSIQMFSIGEETGELEGILEEMAEFYDKESDVGFTKLLALVEPMMLVVIGGIVSIIIISVMLPMLDMFSHIQR